ncbi:MAG: hypothetical protein Kow0090_22020 [Myxococcota bacterium]
MAQDLPSVVSMRELLDAGIHFGHQTRRWNPKMKPYIFGARNGIYIIDLRHTLRNLNAAYRYVANAVAKGEKVLFVATKPQAAPIIKEEASRCNMPYVTHRWLGGMLSNYKTIKQSINKLKEIDAMEQDGSLEKYTKKEVLTLFRKREKLSRNLGGIKDMDGLPGVIFVIDTQHEEIAVKEANVVGVPVVGIVDTNADPEEIEFPIPGNDDAIRAIRLYASKIADACLEGQKFYKAPASPAERERKRPSERGERGRRGARGDRRGPPRSAKGGKSGEESKPAADSRVKVTVKKRMSASKREQDDAETGGGDKTPERENEE